MNRPFLLRLIIAIVFGCLQGGWATAPARAQAEEVDVTGVWDLTVESPQGTANPSITLRQDRERITGIYVGRMGETRLEGTVRRRSIRFTVVLRFQDESFTVVYEGTVGDDEMRGTANFGDATGRWTGVRRR